MGFLLNSGLQMGCSLPARCAGSLLYDSLTNSPEQAAEAPGSG